GTERVPPTSAAMSLSATAVIQAAPNAIIIVNSATLATTQDARLSIEADCNIKKGSGWRSRIAGRRRFDQPHPAGGSPSIFVMAGLVPAIHALLKFRNEGRVRLHDDTSAQWRFICRGHQ